MPRASHWPAKVGCAGVCGHCAASVQQYPVVCGTPSRVRWVVLDALEFPTHLVPPRLRWTVDADGMAAPAMSAVEPVGRTRHQDTCPAGSPSAWALLLRRPRPMHIAGPESPPPLKPLPVAPARPR
ncbi:DUF6083 domain-containing protein [Streptomyces sp. Ru73]|uniref:DUF6083 domain-containing protein n=1 Tax=Streptomyces sp. Ru73 TaxID=2080748 RepID=UPI0035BC220C